MQTILKRERMGEVIDGSTAVGTGGEISCCGIEIKLKKRSELSVRWLVDLLGIIGIAKGSVLQGAELEVMVGTLEGLACYLNSTELPAEVYRTCDINDVTEEMGEALCQKCRIEQIA